MDLMAAIVIGLVDPNGTQFYGYGKMSTANQTTADTNTVFDIGSITTSEFLKKEVYGTKHFKLEITKYLLRNDS